MQNTVRAVVREGKIELLEQIDVADGTELLVTILPDDEALFWLGCSPTALDRIWDNPEDDAYGELLKVGKPPG
jgi:hypothetical protein